MKRYTAAAATDEGFLLAEGPVWDATRQRLLWVDIAAGLVLEGRLADGRIEATRRHEFGGFVGAVTTDAAGRLLVAAQERLVVVDVDGTRTEEALIIAADGTSRLNDGKPDPAGRFLVGTRAYGPSTQERLVRRRDDGGIEVIDADLTLSNGLAWTHGGTRMYSVDTRSGKVFVRDYDAETGRSGERRTFLTIDGYPDGMCSDVEDHVWIAIWGGGQVRRFSPEGDLVGLVDVDWPYTTCPAFAGPDLDTLVITTASRELDERRPDEFPAVGSGRLFVASVDVAGAPVPQWKPSH